MIIYCQICKQGIARADQLSFPLTGEQFQSYDPAHGYPAPFKPGQEWRYMKCPYCKFRPFVEQDKVLINAEKMEFLTVTAKTDSDLVCSHCGKEFKSASGKMGHERTCKKAIA